MIPVFDLGNVMIFCHQERFFEKLMEACPPGTPVEMLFYAAYDREDVSRGGDFEAVYPRFAQQTGLRMSREEFQQAWDDIFAPNPPMVEFVRRLPAPRVLLSNTQASHIAWIGAHLPDVLPLFDHRVFSYEVRLAKPEVAIYHRVAAITGARPEQHVFVDDLEENVEAARTLGWHGIHFMGVGDCRRQLAALGIKESDLPS